MPIVIVVGVQWGDEGKGKVVDYLTERANLVVRFQGGNNAGHTVVVEGKRTALQLIPSGILRPTTRCLLASGVVVDPFALLEEFAKLEEVGISVSPARFGIAGEVQLILPYHKVIDKEREAALAGSKIGTTGKGIGPAYEDAVSRYGIRLIDLYRPEYLRTLLGRNIEQKNRLLSGVLGSSSHFSEEAVFNELIQIADRLKPYMCNVSAEVDAAIKANQFVMFEGAQGCLLDISHGTYPFVTSSNTVAGYACVSAGFGPKAVDHVIGISKAYCTRVGGGPFPTEDLGEDGEVLRAAGREFGTVTGRPRRCGWFDAMAVRRAVRLNGIDQLILTKLDVLSGFKKVKIGKAYRLDGASIADLPVSAEDISRVEVEYEELEGWDADLTGVRSFSALPVQTQRLINRIEELSGTKVAGFSVGPDREQTIIMDESLKGFAQ